jgi:uncharacterized membrane protein (UPF0127 family)
VTVFNETAGASVVERAELATSHWARFWGLMGRRTMPDDAGLVLRPCSSVHMFFMRFPIDVVFADANGVVVKVIERMRPWRMALGGKGASWALEMQADRAIDRLSVGDRLVMRDPD